jgi:hypothetical protein
MDRSIQIRWSMNVPVDQVQGLSISQTKQFYLTFCDQNPKLPARIGSGSRLLRVPCRDTQVIQLWIRNQQRPFKAWLACQARTYMDRTYAYICQISQVDPVRHSPLKFADGEYLKERELYNTKSPPMASYGKS